MYDIKRNKKTNGLHAYENSCVRYYQTLLKIMIPISSSTSLSLDQSAKLVQKVLKLKKEQNVEIPELIQCSINQYLTAHTRLLKNIDAYFHCPVQLVKNVPHGNYNEVTKTIIDTTPEFLATTDEFSLLPMHYQSHFNDEMFVYMVQRGVELNVGGDDKRGGLFHTTRRLDRFGRSTDYRIKMCKRNFELLRNNDPPLFFPKDIVKTPFLHSALSRFSIVGLSDRKQVVPYFIDLNPNCLTKKDSKGRIPLELLCKCNWGDGIDTNNTKVDEFYVDMKLSFCFKKLCIIFRTMEHLEAY